MKWLNPFLPVAASGYLQVLEVQVSLMLVGGLVSAMTVRDDWIKQLLEDLIGLLITSDAAHGHDEGVTLEKPRWTR